MKRKRFNAFFLVRTTSLLVFGVLPALSHAESCPATTQPNADSWGAFPLHYKSFWYGTAALAVPLEKSGVWLGRAERNFVRKLFLYREGFDWKHEPSPILVVTARSVDYPSNEISFGKVSAAYLEDTGTSAITLLAEFPRVGCWEISATYGVTNLTFIVQVDSFDAVLNDGN